MLPYFDFLRDHSLSYALRPAEKQVPVDEPWTAHSEDSAIRLTGKFQVVSKKYMSEPDI